MAGGYPDRADRHPQCGGHRFAGLVADESGHRGRRGISAGLGRRLDGRRPGRARIAGIRQLYLTLLKNWPADTLPDIAKYLQPDATAPAKTVTTKRPRPRRPLPRRPRHERPPRRRLSRRRPPRRHRPGNPAGQAVKDLANLEATRSPAIRWCSPRCPSPAEEESAGRVGVRTAPRSPRGGDRGAAASARRRTAVRCGRTVGPAARSRRRGPPVIPVRLWVPGGPPTRVKVVGLISGRDSYRPPS